MEAPVFVKIEQYKELTKVLESVDSKIREATAMLEHLEQLKAEEDAQLQTWAENLQSVKERSDDLHKSLFAQ